MSVPVSSEESPEAEALRRAQRTNEPSMEEILASIRAIIADDREPAAPKPGPQIVYSSDAPRPAEAARPVEAPRPAPAPAEAASPTVVWTRSVESAAGAEPLPVLEEEEPLMSDETEDEIAATFKSLSESMAAHGRETAEKMAREMLRPMLKTWIDENLPSMVERLVRAEIQRVTRGGR